MSSGALNHRPDEGDEDEWRHGRYTLSDPAHAVHYAEPTTQQAQQQVQQPGGEHGRPSACAAWRPSR